MTSVGSNIASSTGADSSGGPRPCGWVSLTLEEQLENFMRIFCPHHLYTSLADEALKPVARVLKNLRKDPWVDIGSLMDGGTLCTLSESTPLHWAVLMDDRTMVRYILTSGRVNINASTGPWWVTALQYAIIGGNCDIVGDLLEHGADVCICDVDGKSTLYYMVHHKVSTYAILKRILANNVNICDARKNTTLHYAAKEGATDVVTYLLHEKADVNLRNQFGYTPLHHAAKKGALDVVTCLLQHNADIHALDDDGWSPLHIAASEGAMDIVTQLVKHNANVNALAKDGRCPLHIAAKEGHLDIVTHLVEHNANVNALDNDGLSPLHIVAKEGHRSVMTHLVEHNANVNALDEGGLSPLHIAASRKYLDIVTRLLEHNANVNTLDKDGCSPLLHSIRNQWVDTTNELIALGADVHVKDKWSNNALHLAIWAHGNEHNMMDVVKLLRERNVNSNAKNSNGYSPFFVAVAEGHTEVVKELLQSKEKMKLMEECNGQTVIQIAYENGHESTKRALLECDDVSRYIGDLDTDRQVFVDSANSILVGAALIASVTFASWLQPPLGYTTSYLDLAPSSSDINYVDVQHNVSLRAFWVFNTLSFYFAIGTVVFGARSVVPRRKMFIKDIVERLHRNLLVTTILLGFSMFFVIIAFGIAGCIVLTPTLKFQWCMIVPTIFGGLVCLVSLGFLFKTMVEDNLEKKPQTVRLYNLYN